MSAWMPMALVASLAMAAIVGALLCLKPRPRQVVAFADPREERLTGKLAEEVGCSLGQALAAIRREVEIAPSQSDETLIKRAAYHYRQNLPEKTCHIYKDATPG